VCAETCNICRACIKLPYSDGGSFARLGSSLLLFLILPSPISYSAIALSIEVSGRTFIMPIKKKNSKHNTNGDRRRNGASQHKAGDLRTYSTPDTRLEHPDLTVRQSIEKDKDGAEHVRYEVTGNLNAPVPPIRDSKHLDKKQCIEIYRYMLLNRKMEIT